MEAARSSPCFTGETTRLALAVRRTACAARRLPARATATTAPPTSAGTAVGGEAKRLAVIADDNAYLLQNYGARAPPLFTHGKGARLYDSSGKEYLDFMAGIAVNALGHSDPAWVAAVTDQAQRLSHVSNYYHTEPGATLARRLVQSSKFADRAFFCNSGTEANEAAIKFSRKIAKNAAAANPPPSGFAWPWAPVEPPYAYEMVSFTNCFHGRTLGALSLTYKKQYREPFEPLVPGARILPFGDLAAAQAAIVKGKTCAVFVEPIQGEGGINTATKEFLFGLRAACDAAGAQLVFDEVQCGLGRTGSLWAHELVEGLQPDMLTMAKPLANGIPIGAVLMKDHVAAAISPGDHGSTFAGNPLACAAGNAVLDRLLSPGFLTNVTARGAQLKESLTAALKSHPKFKEVRQIGLLVGIEFDAQIGPLIAACRDEGLLVITAGAGNVLRLVPPLIITKDDVEMGVAIIAKAAHAIIK